MTAATLLATASLTAPADAQFRPIGKAKTTKVITAADPATTAVASDVVALKTHADLIIRDLGFTGKGEVTFELRNRGDVPINAPPKPAGSAFATNSLWVEVWLDRRGLVEELDESNNRKEKRLD